MANSQLCGLAFVLKTKKILLLLNIENKKILSFFFSCPCCINPQFRFGKKIETESAVKHNERLEFLGDAVVEFITSVHLFYMFPDLEEGGLATYR